MRYPLIFTILLAVLCLPTVALSAVATSPTALYRDPSQPVEARVSDALARLQLEEKIDLLSGDETGFATKANTRLGIPSIRMTDGPFGVRSGQATAFPSGIAMGATFDPDLIQAAAAAMAVETKALGHDMLLGPCVNISRHPFGGRNFESFGEDPFLTTQLALGYLRGIQSEGVIPSTKHLVLNDQEHKRMFINSVADERTMHEIYFPPFLAAVKNGTATIMAAYNKVNGHWASENHDLLTTLLKEKWGFQGLVVSDWWATHSTVAAARAGLDLEMPNAIYFGNPLLEAVRKGEVSETLINDKVSRLLRVIFATGHFDSVNAARPPRSVVGSNEHLAVALRTAEGSLVLLKNAPGTNGRSVLPLAKENLRKVAVIGAGARHARIGGGGSSMVNPTWVQTPLEALREVAPQVDWRFSLGAPLRGDFAAVPSGWWTAEPNTAVRGVRGDYFANPDLFGVPAFSRIDPNIDFDWGWNAPGLKVGVEKFSVSWSGYLQPTDDFHLTVRSDDGVRLFINDEIVLDAWNDHAERVDVIPFPLLAGKTYKIRMEYYQGGGSAMAGLGRQEDNKEALDAAVRLAAQAEVAVVFAGLSRFYEGETLDLTSMNLPDNQDELIRRVSAANPNTIVVLQGGNPIAMPWLSQVKGVLFGWYGGQEGSEAIARALVGEVNPSGKLPVSFPKSWEEAAAYGYYPEDIGTPDQVTYAEGIYVGYRHFDKKKIEPLFPFGYGLSYTNFTYGNLRVKALSATAENPKVEVLVDVTNTGAVAGAEVAQLYVSELSPSVDRPERELKGFTKTVLQPGEKKTLRLELDRAAFAFYDVNRHDWAVDAGAFTVNIGSSSRDLPLSATVTLN